jgi:hypothetical protein
MVIDAMWPLPRLALLPTPSESCLCLSVALSWRNAVLVGVMFGGIILLWFGRTPLPDSAVSNLHLGPRELACPLLDLLVRAHHGGRY